MVLARPIFHESSTHPSLNIKNYGLATILDITMIGNIISCHHNALKVDLHVDIFWMKNPGVRFEPLTSGMTSRHALIESKGGSILLCTYLQKKVFLF